MNSKINKTIVLKS